MKAIASKINTLILVNATIVTPDSIVEHGTITVSGGRIVGVSTYDLAFSKSGIKVIDCSGKILIPGFIDIHTHGGMGYDFTDGKLMAFESLSRFYFSCGVTSLLATLSPLRHSDLGNIVKLISKYILSNRDWTNIVGIHLEGPYLNPEMVGGNNPDFLEPADIDSFLEILNKSGGFIKLVTLAPEIPGADAVISAAVHRGVMVSAGHSAADDQTFRHSLSLGINQVTHLFNGMPQLHHRSPNILSESLVDDNVFVQVITDGIHIHPSILRLIVKLKGPDRFVSITDSIRATCLPDGEYDSAGLKVSVRNGRVRTAEGVIAGSTMTMDRVFKFLVDELGINFIDASKMTSLNAARSIGVDDLVGSIETGKAADIVAIDNNDYEVSFVMKNGTVMFNRDNDESQTL